MYNGIERERCTSCGGRHFEKYENGLKCRICGLKHKEIQRKSFNVQMTKFFVLEGPITVGNQYGLMNHFIPAKKFAIAFIGKLSNGITAPIIRFPKIYFDTLEKAEALCKCLMEHPKKEHQVQEDYPILDRK